MKKILLFFTFIFFTTCYSQKDPNIYDFFGGKTYGNKTVFFRLVFQINNNDISGYMYTDEQGENSSKSIIKGKYNPITKIIFFNETRKLLTKTKSSSGSLCYLQGSITLELNSIISKLKGAFTEQTDSKLICKNGTINLISPDAYIQLKKQIEKEKEIANTQPIVTPKFDSDKKTVIKSDEEITIYWESSTIKLEIWDDMKEDGDKISISFNKNLILDNYELKNKKKEIEIPLKEKENLLTFTANNTGFLANNTARIDLFDDTIKHQIITELKLNKSVNVIIKTK